MSRPIERIRAKVDRAKHHVEDFDAALKLDAQHWQHAFVVEEDAEAGRRNYRITAVPEVPLRIEAIAADALSNLRMALDHVAYQIELAACGGEPAHLVYFPVGATAARYQTNRRAYIQCAGKPAIYAFDTAQPYKGGRGEGLWQLNALQKADKHHLLIATRPIQGSIDVAQGVSERMNKAIAGDPNWEGVVIPPFPPTFFRPINPEPLEVGDAIYSEPLEVEMYKDRKFRLNVTFDQPGIREREPALKTLQDFTKLVDNVIGAFEPLLP